MEEEQEVDYRELQKTLPSIPVIRHVYSGILLRSNDGEEMGVCMRDSGFEFNYQGTWYEAKNGKVNPLKK